jgi:hypothetical protein
MTMIAPPMLMPTIAPVLMLLVEPSSFGAAFVSIDGVDEVPGSEDVVIYLEADLALLMRLERGADWALLMRLEREAPAEPVTVATSINSAEP